MGETIIDQQTLTQFVDEMMRQRPAPVSTPEELAALRERLVGQLDEKINYAIFDSLDDARLAEVNKMLENEETTEDDFRQFFAAAGVDLEQVTKAAATEFAEQYAGGKNAESEF